MIKTSRPSSSPIELKTSQMSCSHLHIHHCAPFEIQQEIERVLQQAPALMHHLPIVINFDNDMPALSADAISQIIQTLIATELKIIGIIPSKAMANHPFPWPNLAHLSQVSSKEKRPKHLGIKQIQGKIRSGQIIHSDDSHLVIYGDVSSGAELYAAGHIFVFGHLAGKAFAGVHGDSGARIVCHHFGAELVAIAGRYQTYDDLDVQALQTRGIILSLHEDAIHTQSIT